MEAKRRGYTHPTKFTKKNAPGGTPTIQKLHNKIHFMKSDCFQAPMASKTQKRPPRKNSLFDQNTCLLIKSLGDTPFLVREKTVFLRGHAVLSQFSYEIAARVVGPPPDAVLPHQGSQLRVAEFSILVLRLLGSVVDRRNESLDPSTSLEAVEPPQRLF